MIRSGAAATAIHASGPIENIEEDVRQGYMSIKAAAEFYGVVIDPVTFKADRSATKVLRERQVGT